MLAAALVAALAGPVAAQDSADAVLQRAVARYDQMEIEDAATLFTGLVAPPPGLTVSVAQQARAYKYLGAIFALESGPGKRDSAIAFFDAAIARDPLTDLDAQRFTPVQVAVFTEARSRIFAVALRPLQADTLDSTSSLTFQCLSSQAGSLHVQLATSSGAAFTLYDGPTNGVQPVPWDLRIPGDSEPAGAGHYDLKVVGRSADGTLADSTTVAFAIQVVVPPLEDTVADLGPNDTLPDSDANHQEIPANVAENQRRQADRAAFNAGVLERNALASKRARRVIVP